MERLLAVALLVVPSVLAADSHTTPADVYQKVQDVTANIGLIRTVTGRPISTAEPWRVVDAQPRHVFYQAQTLFRKANLLATELGVSERRAARPAPDSAIEPRHVFQLVNDAAVEVEGVRRELAIAVVPEAAPFDESRQPSEVYTAIVQASRQLNLLLDREFRPEDVYDRVLLASTYAAGALTDAAGNPGYGELPPFEPAKTPADVYRRVLECLQLTTSIAEKNALSALKVDLRRELRRRDIRPADVYDVATTVLSELAHITLEMDGRGIDMPPIPRPRHIFPSHVYQIASMLQEQLAQIERGAR